jgi:hypothetical protein
MRISVRRDGAMTRVFAWAEDGTLNEWNPIAWPFASLLNVFDDDFRVHRDGKRMIGRAEKISGDEFQFALTDDARGRGDRC